MNANPALYGNNVSVTLTRTGVRDRFSMGLEAVAHVQSAHSRNPARHRLVLGQATERSPTRKTFPTLHSPATATTDSLRSVLSAAKGGIIYE